MGEASRDDTWLEKTKTIISVNIGVCSMYMSAIEIGEAPNNSPSFGGAACDDAERISNSILTWSQGKSSGGGISKVK